MRLVPQLLQQLLLQQNLASQAGVSHLIVLYGPFDLHLQSILVPTYVFEVLLICVTLMVSDDMGQQARNTVGLYVVTLEEALKVTQTSSTEGGILVLRPPGEKLYAETILALMLAYTTLVALLHVQLVPLDEP